MFFVSVGFSDSRVGKLFDLARIILEPEFARPAHITLRGPYKNRKDISPSILGKDVGKIGIGRPGTFFAENQSTVFLAVEILGVSDFWYKPDFPNGTPHLSIYDGRDRQFAWSVFNVLRRYKWGVVLNSTPMHILEKKKRLETEFLTDYANVSFALADVAGRVYSAEEIKQLTALDRIVLLDRICKQILFLSKPSAKFI